MPSSDMKAKYLQNGKHETGKFKIAMEILIQTLDSLKSGNKVSGSNIHVVQF
jgi:hypothetical protein